MGASRGYIPRTFLRKLGADGARPAWFVLFLAAAATAAAWAGALVLLCLVKSHLRKRARPSFGFQHASFSVSGAGTPLAS
ncbi:hypothetical protein B5F84_08320 [Olsenella sp. An290]|nr:hypothetical protein B5F84_08320 [Olsenella sp. An290]